MWGNTTTSLREQFTVFTYRGVMISMWREVPVVAIRSRTDLVE